jgi:hypothetical protein
VICLLNRRNRGFAVDLFVRVIRADTDLIGLPQRFAVLQGNATGLDEMQAEGGDEAAVSPDQFGLDGFRACKQRSPRRIRHRIVGPIASSIQIPDVD